MKLQKNYWGTTMFDEKKRREELKDIISNYPFEVNKYDKIIHDEKFMIEQAEKEAVKKFAEKLKLFGFWKDDCNTVIIYAADIDKLLKEYEEGFIASD
jgi:selenophosphate synthetase-related protein